MGTSVQMIDETYGHLARDSEDQDRDLSTPSTRQTTAAGTLWARQAGPRQLGSEWA
jgi:hypothetical protein